MLQISQWRGRGGAGRSGGSRGGSRGGGSRAGTGRHGRSAGVGYRAPSSPARAPSVPNARPGNVAPPRKNVYTQHTNVTSGGKNYNVRQTTHAGPVKTTVSEAYGPARGNPNGYGQSGTGRGGQQVNLNSPTAQRALRTGGFVGGAVQPSSNKTPAIGGGGGGGSSPSKPPAVAPPDPAPTPTPGRERSLRIRNSPARRTALGRARRARGSRRSARVSVGGLSRGSSSRSGVTV